MSAAIVLLKERDGVYRLQTNTTPEPFDTGPEPSDRLPGFYEFICGLALFCFAIGFVLGYLAPRIWP